MAQCDHGGDFSVDASMGIHGMAAPASSGCYALARGRAGPPGDCPRLGSEGASELLSFKVTTEQEISGSLQQAVEVVPGRVDGMGLHHRIEKLGIHRLRPVSVSGNDPGKILVVIGH